MLVGDEVFAHNKVLRAYRYAVLEVALIFIEGVVLVYILHVGHRARTLVEGFGHILGSLRVTFHSVVALVSLKDGKALLIVVVAAEKVIVVAGRVVQRGELVGLHLVESLGGKPGAELVKIAGICGEGIFVVVLQPVETDILHHSRTGIVVECVRE